MNNEQLKTRIIGIIEEKIPGKKVKTVEEKGVWIKHIFKATFEDGGCVYFKMAVHGDSDLEMEANVTGLLAGHGIAQPEVLCVDMGRTAVPYPYIIQEGGSGVPLSKYLINNKPEQLLEIYHVLGEYYGRFSGISSSWAGVWDTVPGKAKYPVHPAEAMYRLEIERGAGAKACSEGALSQETYDRVKHVWLKYLPMLKEKPVSLVHYSPFPWTIYISGGRGCFSVSKITALGDILWWDADVTAAHIMYPPFFNIDESLQKAFLEGYGREVDMKSVNLYSIMHRLCAWAGTYAEPDFAANGVWRAKAVRDVDHFLDALN